MNETGLEDTAIEEGSLVVIKDYFPHVTKTPGVKRQLEDVERSILDFEIKLKLLANIREVFMLNMSELAPLFNITRPTAYAWLQGQEPKAVAAIQRIQQLSRIADKIKSMGIKRLDTLIHRPIFNGRSLFEILKAGEDPSELLTILKVIADKEDVARRTQKGSGKDKRSLNDLGNDSVTNFYTPT